MFPLKQKRTALKAVPFIIFGKGVLYFLILIEFNYWVFR